MLWSFSHIPVLQDIRTSCTSEGRFKSCLIDSDAYLLTCMRYIELNSVRAKMVKHPSEHRWSSYAFNATGKSNKLIKPHALYLGLCNENEQSQYAYRELFSSDLYKDEIHWYFCWYTCKSNSIKLLSISYLVFKYDSGPGTIFCHAHQIQPVCFLENLLTVIIQKYLFMILMVKYCCLSYFFQIMIINVYLRINVLISSLCE